MQKNQRCTAAFRAEAVKLVLEQNLSHQEAAKRQGDHLGRFAAMPPTVAASMQAFFHLQHLRHPCNNVYISLGANSTRRVL